MLIKIISLHQAQFKNQYPVVFVHGFLGFAGDNQFSLAQNIGVVQMIQY